MGEPTPATIDDARQLAPRLRRADLEEMQAAQGPGVDVERMLCFAVAASPEPLALRVDGAAVAIAGCVPLCLLTGTGVPWMLGAPEAERMPRELLVWGRRVVARWLEQHRLLENWADARNVRSLRWLQRLGFTIEPARPYGAAGLPFHHFHRCA